MVEIEKGCIINIEYRDKENDLKNDEDNIDGTVIEMDDLNEPAVSLNDISNEDKNSYAKSKVAAQGMMDIALITANANQLRYILQYQYDKKMYYIILILISLSLSLQVTVGVCLTFKGRRAFGKLPKRPIDRAIKNFVVCLIFLITITNVFIACFTITENKNN